MTGDTPRVGKRLDGELDKSGARDTPTCVGKRSRNKNPGHIVKGHPHVCGEEFEIGGAPDTGIGTPPRVWGRAKRPFLSLTLGGDTPTCVGKSLRAK